jgi:hypothetical protein
MGTEQFIGSIEEVEHPHDEDHTESGAADPWDEFAARLGSIKESFRNAYEASSDGAGPSQEEIRSAFAVLGDMWSSVAGSVTSALRDEMTRQQLAETAGSLASAVGDTLSQLGTEIRRGADEEE